MRLSTISSAAMAWSTAARTVDDAHVDVEVGAEHERDLRLDLGLQESVHRDGAAVGHLHVVEQHAEVGPVHAELRLHGGRGQPDLASHDPGARRDAAPRSAAAGPRRPPPRRSRR